MDAARQCKAKSKRSGERCRRAAIVGGAVCHMHGGASGPTREAARRRLAAAADPAAGVLVDLCDHPDPTIRLRSSQAVLDRAVFERAAAEWDPPPEKVRAARAAQLAQLSSAIAGVLTDLGHDPADPDVRAVVVARLRALSADTRHESIIDSTAAPWAGPLDTSARELGRP